MRKGLILLPLLAAMLSSCLKDELPVPKRPFSAAAREVQVCLGATYKDQVWLDLGTGTVMATNAMTAWDLAFDGEPDGWRIRLNSAKKMCVLNKGVVDITLPHDTVGFFASARYDTPSGHSDSTSIGDWQGTNNVYIVDLGINHLGQRQGYRKFRFNTVSSTSYTFEVAALDGTGLSTVTVEKDPTRYSTSYKVGQGVVSIEPPKGEWDVVVTRYTHLFHEPFMPYLVTGALSATNTRAATVPGAVFENVVLADTIAHPMSSARDAIGYDWKVYLFDPPGYVIDQSKVFIVEDQEGAFYKMHFIDFYNEQGQTGCPQFRIERF